MENRPRNRNREAMAGDVDFGMKRRLPDDWIDDDELADW
jgi:hypothetical protein